MSYTVTIDWKFMLALGATTVAVIFALKMSGNSIEIVSVHIADACKEYAISLSSNC